MFLATVFFLACLVPPEQPTHNSCIIFTAHHFPFSQDAQQLLSLVQKDRSLPGPADAARAILKLWKAKRYFTKAPTAALTLSTPEQSQTSNGALTKAMTPEEWTEVLQALTAEIMAVPNWGEETSDEGGLMMPAAAGAGAPGSGSAMAVDAVDMGAGKYFEMRYPVEEDLKTVKVGGPEPVFLGGGGEAEDEDMSDDEEEESGEDEDMSMEEEDDE